MPENIEDLFNEAIQADEAGGEKEQEEKEEETTETENEPKTEQQQEEDNDDSTEEKKEEESSEENLSEEDEDIDDPALILQRYKTLQGMYRSQKQKLEELSKGNDKKDEEPPKEEPVNQETPNEKDEKIDTSWVNEALSSDEDVKEFAEEFPEIHAVLEKSLKAVMERYTQAMSQAFQTLLQQIDQKYQPIASSVTQITKKEKDEAIMAQHSDYPTLIQSQELKDWIDSQPKTLKKAYSEILENGSAEDMIEMLNDFKLKTGIKSTQESQPAPKKKPKVSPQTKTKAPSSKPPVDMDDFEQAFYEAIKEGD